MRASIVAVLCLPLALTGCTLTNTGTPSPVQGATISGSVHGGQQPIAGSHVFLFAATEAGYSQPAISLLGNNSVTTGLTKDNSVGNPTSGDWYATTDGSGNFSITGVYSCTAGQQVYMYALGGNPGAGTNNGAALMAVLGNCPGSNFVGTISFININEVTTVAAAYAISGFATDATHVSASSTAHTGLKNAFANAANLASIVAGSAATTTAGGNGTPPTSEINTLANALAACINSDGAVSGPGPNGPTACYTLFTSATADGTVTGTQPTDTATAAINIAHNPGVNVAAIYGLPTPQAPFAPVLASMPNDWTVGIQFLEGGDPSGTGTNDPFAIAIDQNGDVWAANNGHAVGVVAELGPDGAVKSTPSGFTDGTPAVFDGIAIDTHGNIWVPSYFANSLLELSGTDGSVKTVPGGITGGGMNGPRAIAVDGSDNIWVVNQLGNTVSEYVTAGTPAWTVTSPYGSGILSNPYGIAVDHTGNAWVSNKSGSTLTEVVAGATSSNSSAPNAGGINQPIGVAIDPTGDIWTANTGGFPIASISELANAGTAISPFSGYPVGAHTGGIVTPQTIAIDGAGHVWTGDQSNVTIDNNTVSPIAEFDDSGNPISPDTGYIAPGIVDQIVSIAIDGSGNVWAADPSTNYLVELIGAATPVVTPLSVAAQTNTLGTRP
jgi:streptogramin lyase